MKTLILKDKEELDFILSLEELGLDKAKIEVDKRGYKRSEDAIKYVWKLNKAGKVAFVKDEYLIVKELYTKNGCSLEMIERELKAKGYVKDRGLLSKLLEDYNLKKGVVFSKKEVNLINKLFCEERKSLRVVLAALKEENKYRTMNRLLKYIEDNDLEGGVRWTEEEKDIVRKYFPIGGSVLCKEKGLQKSIKLISGKAQSLGVKLGKPYKKWEEWEDEFLVENINEMSIGDLANLLDRSEDSVRRKLSLKGIPIESKLKLWTDEEDDIIRKYYEKGGAKLCQEKGLQRSTSSIYDRSYLLGYKSSSRWSKEEEQILIDYYEEGGYKLCQEKGLAKPRYSIIQKASKLGLNRGRQNRGVVKWTAEELSILKEYYKQGGSRLCIEKGVKRHKKVITSKAYQLGLKYKPVNYWSDAELDIIRKYYGIGGYKLCQEKGLNRNDTCIISQAYKLGVQSNRNSNE